MRRLELTGEKFGKLTVIRFSHIHQTNGQTCWECLCECGNKKIVKANALKTNWVRSCGCLVRESSRKRSKWNGLTVDCSLEASSLYSAIRRCTDTEDTHYADYGGRGIKVCNRWLNESGLKNFINDMGLKPTSKHTLERVNNDKGYSPKNCIWATKTQQVRNRRTTIVIEYNGIKKSLSDWADEKKLTHATLYQRLKKHGWPIDRALTTPARGK